MSDTSRAIANQKAEQAVIDRVKSYDGWECSPYGPPTDDPIRGMLADVKPSSALRWFPDLIATNGKEVSLIEVKSTRAGNRNWAIEKQSLAVAKQLNDEFKIRVAYAWVDSDNNIEAFVHYEELILLPMREGPQRGKGSGTPYWLIERSSYEV
jgi:hypothetical protein